MGYLFAPALITRPRNLRPLPSRTLITVAQVMVRIRPNLLTRRELQHVLLLMLIRC